MSVFISKVLFKKRARMLLDAAREHARLYGLNLHAHPAIAYGRTKEGKAFPLFEKNWGHGGTPSSYKTDR